jgi:hypothetical protein
MSIFCKFLKFLFQFLSELAITSGHFNVNVINKFINLLKPSGNFTYQQV